jgi:drug/metabolite transporter (DMT)-like permease
MTSFRHLAYFVALGLFWGISPSQYAYWGKAGVPVSHILVYTGFGLAVFLSILARWKHGQVGWSRDVLVYSFTCAVLMNVPFALSLTFARHVPAAELALIWSLSPIVNFVVGAVSGREPVTVRRTAAILLGFLACVVLVLTRDGMVTGDVSWWLIASFVNPLLYAAYNWYANRHWPRGGTTFSIGAAESLWTGVLGLPFMLALAEPWNYTYTALAYGTIAVATLMWVAERISYFTLIREKGASYTAQAVYLSAPAAVVFGVIFFGGVGDLWLWASLAVLMAALYLNNSAPAARPQSA